MMQYLWCSWVNIYDRLTALWRYFLRKTRMNRQSTDCIPGNFREFLPGMTRTSKYSKKRSNLKQLTVHEQDRLSLLGKCFILLNTFILNLIWYYQHVCDAVFSPKIRWSHKCPDIRYALNICSVYFLT